VSLDTQASAVPPPAHYVVDWVRHDVGGGVGTEAQLASADRGGAVGLTATVDACEFPARLACFYIGRVPTRGGLVLDWR
jgi:hypothetical protein